MRTFIAAKVHGLRVTDKALHYSGSQTIPASVMNAAGILPYEQVHVLNMSNGARWVTYAIPGPEAVCSLNGAAARQGEVGDELILITYQSAAGFPGAKVVFCDDNRAARRLDYDRPVDALNPADICFDEGVTVTLNARKIPKRSKSSTTYPVESVRQRTKSRPEVSGRASLQVPI